MVDVNEYAYSIAELSIIPLYSALPIHQFRPGLQMSYLSRLIFQKLTRYNIQYMDLRHAPDAVDIIHLKHSNKVIDPTNTRLVRRIKTLLIDLKPDETEIYKSFNKTTKQELNRVARDQM